MQKEHVMYMAINTVKINSMNRNYSGQFAVITSRVPGTQLREIMPNIWRF